MVFKKVEHHLQIFCFKLTVELLKCPVRHLSNNTSLVKDALLNQLKFSMRYLYKEWQMPTRKLQQVPYGTAVIRSDHTLRPVSYL